MSSGQIERRKSARNGKKQKKKGEWKQVAKRKKNGKEKKRKRKR